MASYDPAKLEEELIRDEGIRLRAYKDSVGIWTIGIGRNLDQVGITKAETAELGITTASAKRDGITREQAIALFRHDIANCAASLDNQLSWWRTLDPVRQRVIMNMCFNLGIKGLLGFTNTLAAIKRGAWAVARSQMLSSKWATQVGNRARRLADMMLTGVSE